LTAAAGRTAARPKTDLHRLVQYALAAGYVGFVVFGLVSPFQPRVFWTMLLPLLVVAIVLMGFPSWRRICPLAFFGEAGRVLDRGVRRRAPPWLERWFFPVTLAILYAMLVFRLVATNGDGRWLSALLIGLAIAAAATNAFWSGKTWCNFFCPVSVTEHIYTDPGSLYPTASSQCSQCTACKKHCPDVDQENAYWKDATSSGRRLAFYSFPGLVFAFYFYYWLRAGDWEAYFDGRWTRQPVTWDLWFGPGFFFAPRVPALFAAALSLFLFSAASWALFRGVEAVAAHWIDDVERRRHLVLALAAFSAWNLFYLFAGAPTLRRLPYGTRVAAFIAPLVATLVLAKRWRRSHGRYIAEQGATRLLKNWEFEEPPPRDAGEVYGWIKASRHAREKDLAAYANTVRDMIADGLVGAGELRLLEGVRRQLGISEREHERILARLSEEDRHLFDPRRETGIESRAQHAGFERALAEALLRSAPASELEELRSVFGVSRQDHEAALERLRGAGGPLVERARRQLDRAVELRRALAAIGSTEPTAARVFLCSLLAKARDEAVDRVLELLEIAGDGPMIQALRRRLYSSDAAERAMALELLEAACPGASALIVDLEPLLARRNWSLADGEIGSEEAEIANLLGSSDPYLRAAAVWAAATFPFDPELDVTLSGVLESAGVPGLEAALARAANDEHPLVRETAVLYDRARRGAGGIRAAAGGVSLPTHLSTIETMHLLHAVPIFSGLDPEDLHELALYAIDDSVAPPAVLFEERDPDCDALFVVLDGRIAIERAGDDGAIVPVESVGPGAVVGELSVLDGSRRDSTARPESGPVRVLRIPGARFRSGLLRRGRVTEWLLGAMAGRIRRLSVPPPAPRQR
jgi:hypothetical protein